MSNMFLYRLARRTLFAVGTIFALSLAAHAAAPLQKVDITVDGVARVFYVHVPTTQLPQPAPAVLVFHGYGGSGSSIASVSQMSQDGFVAVYPEAIDGRWNEDDDIAFVRAIIAALVAEWNVDASRIFASGFSNGGLFTQRLACEFDFAGYAVVAANLVAALRDVCNPTSNPAPIVFFSGTADGAMPFNGATGPNGMKTILSSSETVQFWAKEAGCRMSSRTTRNLPNVSNDGTTVSYEGYHKACKIAARYIITGGGHTWPGSSVGGQPGEVTSQDIDATAIMLKFFGLR